MTERQGVAVRDLRVDESYWPAGSSEIIRRFLAEEYDPTTMPPLITSRRDDGLHYVLGWSVDDAGPGYRWPLVLLVHMKLDHEERDGRCLDGCQGLRLEAEEGEP